MRGEISYDLVMDDDMEFVEGSFRLEEGPWQVVIVSKKPVAETVIRPSVWSSGVEGIVIHVPEGSILNKGVVEQIMSERFGVHAWAEVDGPDSMMLR